MQILKYCFNLLVFLKVKCFWTFLSKNKYFTSFLLGLKIGTQT